MRALVDSCFKRFEMARDALVAFADIVDHSVERLAEHGRFVGPGGGRHAAGEVLRRTDLGHHGRQLAQRSGEALDHRLRDHHTADDGGQRDGRRPEKAGQHVGTQITDIRQDDDLADPRAAAHNVLRNRSAVGAEKLQP